MCITYVYRIHAYVYILYVYKHTYANVCVYRLLRDVKTRSTSFTMFNDTAYTTLCFSAGICTIIVHVWYTMYVYHTYSNMYIVC